MMITAFLYALIFQSVARTRSAPSQQIFAVESYKYDEENPILLPMLDDARAFALIYIFTFI